jgi:hypothetical protein
MYQDMYNDSAYFDLHQYNGIFEPFRRDDNKKVLGKFTDEKPNLVISEFVGLKAKMYALKTYNLNPTTKPFCEGKRAKGVGKRARDKQLSIEDYKKSIDENDQKPVKMRTIQSFKHKLYTLEQTKRATCPFEDKRFWLDSRRSLAHGHRDCKLFE